MGLTKILGVILFFALLHNPVQALQSVSLAWGPSPDSTVVGYKMYYGVASRTYTNLVDVGNATSGRIPGLVEGTTYYFAATAYDQPGVESEFSNEVGYTVALPNTPPTIALTAPVNAASYTAPAAISLAASVTANGQTITKVQFYNGATLLGEDAATPYSFTWSSVSAGSYSLTARAVYAAGSTVASAPVSVNVTGLPTLPAPWQTTDIGNVSVVGSASMTNGIYTVKGAGNISGTADSFRFVSQPLSGDGMIFARLNSLESSGTNGRIGVMIRESLTSGSKYAFLGISPEGIFSWQGRTNTGSGISTSASTLGMPSSVWIALSRSGNVFHYSLSSSSGTNRTLVSSQSITMAANIHVGLAVAFGSSNTLNLATFPSVTVLP